MGPGCEVLLEGVDDALLDGLDALLASFAERVERTRKGRVWDIMIGDRPFHVCVDESPPAVVLSAACNDSDDWALLSDLAQTIAERFGGIASPPEK